MILDLKSLLSDGQAITATAVSTNVIDLGAPGKTGYNGIQLVRNNKGDCIPLLVQVTEAFNNLTSLAIAVQGSVDSAFTSPVVLESHTVLLASLVAGFQLRIMQEIPPSNIYRYLRMNYTVTGTAPSTGKVTVGVTTAIDAAYKG